MYGIDFIYTNKYDSWFKKKYTHRTGQDVTITGIRTVSVTSTQPSGHYKNNIVPTVEKCHLLGSKHFNPIGIRRTILDFYNRL